MSVTDHIRAYHDRLAGDEHHRLRSWEHCYRYFRRVGPTGLDSERDTAALQLGFYLASWGMYRGSSFLLRYAYTAHRPVIDLLAEPRFLPLWEREFGAGEHDAELQPLVLAAVAGVRRAYAPFATRTGKPTETLITKVLLGMLGCLPACDRYFLVGFKADGYGYSALNEPFAERLLGQLDRVDLLIVDELGYLSFSRGGAELLFQVFADRYERRSVLVTSNLAFSEWGTVFQGDRMTAALLDRLTHRCEIFEMNNESYRFRESMKAKKEKDPKKGK